MGSNVMDRIPRPKGEGAAKRRVRGARKSFCTPHPALRATLSLRARDSIRNIFHYPGFGRTIPRRFILD
jgi:hypothetical protein